MNTNDSTPMSCACGFRGYVSRDEMREHDEWHRRERQRQQHEKAVAGAIFIAVAFAAFLIMMAVLIGLALLIGPVPVAIGTSIVAMVIAVLTAGGATER